MTDRSETSAAVVGCLAVVRRGEQVLLVQRAKPPGVGKWGFPGGHLEPGETASACAVRELREETAIAADPVEILTAFDFSAGGPGGARQYRLIAVLCDWREGDGELLEDASALGWFTIQAAEQLDTFPDALAAMRLALGADRRHGTQGDRRSREGVLPAPPERPRSLPAGSETEAQGAARRRREHDENVAPKDEPCAQANRSLT